MISKNTDTVSGVRRTQKQGNVPIVRRARRNNRVRIINWNCRDKDRGSLFLKRIRKHIEEITTQFVHQVKLLMYVAAAFVTLEVLRILHEFFSTLVIWILK
ncbi:MAG: hypothetical protein WCD37_19560 [Chloroflexia bacterium]